MVKFYILPSKLQREAIMLQEVALTTGYVQKMVANAADGLSSIGIGEVGPNIWAIEQALAKQKSMLDLLGESLGDIIRRVNSAEDTVLGSLPSDFAVPTEHPNNPMMYNVNNGWRVGGGVGPGNGFSAPTFMGRSLPVVLRDANGAGNSDDPFSEFLSGNDDKRPEFDYEKSDINNGYYALKNPVPMSQFDYDAMGSGWHEVIQNGQVVGYQVSADWKEEWFNEMAAPSTTSGSNGFELNDYYVGGHDDAYFEWSNNGAYTVGEGGLSDASYAWNVSDNWTGSFTAQVGGVSTQVSNGGIGGASGGSAVANAYSLDFNHSNGSTVGIGVNILGISGQGALYGTDDAVSVGGGAGIDVLTANLHGSTTIGNVPVSAQVSGGVSIGAGYMVDYNDGVLSGQATLGPVDLQISADISEPVDDIQSAWENSRPVQTFRKTVQNVISALTPKW